MNELLFSDLTDKILHCAVAVHRGLGPGLTEYSYQSSLALEMDACQIPYETERVFQVRYRDRVVGWHKPDFIVDNRVIVEIKSVANLDPIFTKQVLTYLRVTGLKVGLLV